MVKCTFLKTRYDDDEETEQDYIFQLERYGVL
jgi:hypothetical protein